MNSSLLHPSQRSSSPAEVVFRKLLKPLVDSHFSAPVSCLTYCLASCAVPSSKQSTPPALPIPLSKACLRRTTCTPRLAYSLFSTCRSSPLCQSPFKNTVALSRSMDSLSVVDEHAKEQDKTQDQSARGAAQQQDFIVQYIVLRKDLVDTLKWPLGSVISQACHAAVAAIWLHQQDSMTAKYCSPENLDHMTKVTLEVKGEIQLQNLSKKLEAAGIAHKLWIEQPEDIPTCLATKPYPKKSHLSITVKREHLLASLHMYVSPQKSHAADILGEDHDTKTPKKRAAEKWGSA